MPGLGWVGLGWYFGGGVNAPTHTRTTLPPLDAALAWIKYVRNWRSHFVSIGHFTDVCQVLGEWESEGAGFVLFLVFHNLFTPGSAEE